MFKGKGFVLIWEKVQSEVPGTELQTWKNLTGLTSMTDDK